MSIQTVGQLALASIDVLNEREWCQGHLSDPDGRVCLMGAINTAAYGEAEPNEDGFNYNTPAIGAISNAMRDLGIFSQRNGCVISIDGWNDNPYRTPLQVGVALMKVALNYGSVPFDPVPSNHSVV